MAQAGPEVLAVVVALLLVEGGLGVQAPQCGLQPQQLRLPPPPSPVLAADVLGQGTENRKGALALLAGDLGLTQAHAHSLQGPRKWEEGDLQLFILGHLNAIPNFQRISSNRPCGEPGSKAPHVLAKERLRNASFPC